MPPMLARANLLLPLASPRAHRRRRSSPFTTACQPAAGVLGAVGSWLFLVVQDDADRRLAPHQAGGAIHPFAAELLHGCVERLAESLTVMPIVLIAKVRDC